MTCILEIERQHHLTGLYAALIQHCEAEIKQMRTTFQMELGRIKNPGAQAAYRGNHTVDTCWQALASDDFIRVVRDVSNLCGTQIGAVPLLPENAIPTPKQKTGRWITPYPTRPHSVSFSNRSRPK